MTSQAVGLGAACRLPHRDRDGRDPRARLELEADRPLPGWPRCRGSAASSAARPGRPGGAAALVVDGIHAHDVGAGSTTGASRCGWGTTAWPLHRRFGIAATVRASFHVYSTPEEVDALVDARRAAREFFGVASGDGGRRYEAGRVEASAVGADVPGDHPGSLPHPARAGLREPFDAESFQITPPAATRSRYGCGWKTARSPTFLRDASVAQISQARRRCSPTSSSASRGGQPHGAGRVPGDGAGPRPGRAGRGRARRRGGVRASPATRRG
jgi:hypothetical protein